MKKFFVLILAVLVAFLSFGYFKLFRGQTNYYKTIAASDDSVLVLNNFDLGRIKIVTADTNEISFEIEGDPESLAALEQENDGLFTKFGLSKEFSELSGTITVPEGTLIDLTLSENSGLKINGNDLITTNSLLVDSNGLGSIVMNDGELLFSGSDEIILWDDDSWQLLDDDSQQDDSSGTGSNADEPSYCGVGSQAIRNYCCVNQNLEADTPPCEGFGHWIFDNVERQCFFLCEAVELEEEDEDMDCSVGAQSERNSCCAQKHEGEYQGCLGSWNFNNAAKACDFDCDSGGSAGDSVGQGGSEGDGDSYDDPISNYCAVLNNEDDKSLCCNDSLKNDLSTGPRPGFPDCIGTWYFDGDSGCEFECADRAEMIEILNQIKQNLKNKDEL